MNKMRVFLLFAVLVGVISACQSKSEQTAGQEQDTMDDSLLLLLQKMRKQSSG